MNIETFRKNGTRFAQYYACPKAPYLITPSAIRSADNKGFIFLIGVGVEGQQYGGFSKLFVEDIAINDFDDLKKAFAPLSEEMNKAMLSWDMYVSSNLWC